MMFGSLGPSRPSAAMAVTAAAVPAAISQPTPLRLRPADGPG
ncbi:hypothetical protein [Frankia sp. AgB32]|nr:hypothetical protein [Frankia sp. AgB32]